MKTMTTSSVEETRNLAKEFAHGLLPGTILCLDGDLGSGKTAFAQGILESLGAKRPYISPTFLIIKEYRLPQTTPEGVERVYHIDAYRVGSKDLLDQGWRDVVKHPEAITIIEWPERVAEIIPRSALHISFSWISERERAINLPDTNQPNNETTTDDPAQSPFL